MAYTYNWNVRHNTAYNACHESNQKLTYASIGRDEWHAFLQEIGKNAELVQNTCHACQTVPLN